MPLDKLTLDKLKGLLTPSIALVGVLLAILITVAYLYAICVAIQTAGQPPLVADPAATTLPTSNPPPPQLRGAVNEHENIMATIAVVSPLVTTVIGFYFGTRAGAAGQDAQISRARLDTQNAILDFEPLPDAQSKNLIDELRTKNLL